MLRSPLIVKNAAATAVGRRDVIKASGSLALGLLWPGAQAIANVTGAEVLNFAALRNDSAFGSHVVRFTRESDRLIVDIEISFDLKFAFIPLYRYRHRNREVWRDGRLVELVAETDDNGTSYEVKARAEDDLLLVEGSSGKLEMAGDILPTSYWSEKIGSRGEWLDTQSGAIVRSAVTRGPAETIEAAGKLIEATPYQLEGDITCKLWYWDGNWVKLSFLASDGSLIDYVLE